MLDGTIEAEPCCGERVSSERGSKVLKRRPDRAAAHHRKKRSDIQKEVSHSTTRILIRQQRSVLQSSWRYDSLLRKPSEGWFLSRCANATPVVEDSRLRDLANRFVNQKQKRANRSIEMLRRRILFLAVGQSI